jgi:hypothetical protein
MFVVGATRTFDISLVGRVTVAELLAFGFVPYFWLSKKGESWANGNFWRCILVLALLFFGVIVSDFINENYFWFSARAFARPVFMLGFLMFFIGVLRRDPLSVIYMVYGGVIAGILKYFRGSEFEVEAAQFIDGYAGIVFRILPVIAGCIIASAVFIYPRSRFLAAITFFIGAAIGGAIGVPRSSLLVLLATGTLLLLIRQFKGRHSRRIVISKSRLLIMSLIMCVVTSLVYVSYIYAAPRGYLGEEQLVKYENQANQRFGATPWGLVLSGRPQVYGAVLGIIEQPIFGFGSWRHDITSKFVVEAVVDVGADARVLDNLRKGAQVDGAGHSVFFQSWVENGIIPALGFLCAFIISLKVLIFNIKYENRMTPFILFSFVSFSWSFLFSPPDLSLRFLIGFFMALYVVYMDKNRALSRVDVLSI